MCAVVNRVFLMGCLILVTGDADDMNSDADGYDGRFVRYQFTPQFLKLSTVGATYVSGFDYLNCFYCDVFC